jgi:uncharacterized protein YaiE (UPF0345 family)
MTVMPESIEHVSVALKANVYFDGKVVSHTIITEKGEKKTLGIIFGGSYTFNTEAPERMDILRGDSRVKLAGEKEWKNYKAGTTFRVPGKSAFEIAVDAGLVEYLCTFEK